MRKIIATALVAVTGALSLAACSSDADVASHNLSKEADNFQIQRRIVFYNGITDKYIFEVDGLCSIGNQDRAGEVSVTCKVGPDKYVKHYLGLSDNVTWFAEQLQSADVSTSHYKVVFKPSTIVPDVDFR